jgi:hypothetical protein
MPLHEATRSRRRRARESRQSAVSVPRRCGRSAVALSEANAVTMAELTFEADRLEARVETPSSRIDTCYDVCT